MRLQKYLSQTGICSRRAGENLIREGRVQVNGRVVTEMGFIVNPESDSVDVDNHPVVQARTKEYFLLHKPTGYVTTLKDPYGRPTVRELIRDAGVRAYPVGRLDMDTSGLLLLTNDGELAHRLSHPSYGVEKEYLARVRDLPTSQTLEQLARGVVLDDGVTAPARVRLVRGGRPTSLVTLIIMEGRNRQVRRMLEAVGHPVVSLKRVRFGKLSLEGLAEGEWRRLNSREVAELYTTVNLVR
jgi:23S rRNA pseudouridine2605 synthase